MSLLKRSTSEAKRDEESCGVQRVIARSERRRSRAERSVRLQSLSILGAVALSMIAPAAFADYAECLGGPRQTDTLRNPLVPGAPSGQPGQIAFAPEPPAVGSGNCAPGVVPGDLGGSARVPTGYHDPTHGSFFPATGSQGNKYPYGYVGGAGRYPTQSGYQQGMYDWGQGARYGQGTYARGASNLGIPTYESGMGNWGSRSYDWGQGLIGRPTYESGIGSYWGQRTYEGGGKINGMPTYDSGMGNYGQRSFDWGQGLAGRGTYDSGAGNYGQQTYDNGAESSGMPMYDNGAGNGGMKKYDNGGGNYGQRMYETGTGNGGTQLYSGRSMGGGQTTYDNGQGNGGKKLGDGGAGNGGTKTSDFGSGSSGNQIGNEGGAVTGARGVVNNGGPRGDANQQGDQVFAHGMQPNNYDFQGPLPTVRTFSRYLVILGVVAACVWVGMASVGVIMGNRNGVERVVGAVAGLLLLLAGYTIWKIVQMNTFHGNTTGWSANTRGMAQPRQQNGPVNPPQNFAPPEDPGATQPAPGAGANNPEQRDRGYPMNYRPVNPKTPNMSQGPYNYRPQGPYSGHPQGPGLVGSYRIPSAGGVPEPPEMPVINPNR